MRSELKRALLKKSNIILIVAVVGLMIINAYYGGWRTRLKRGFIKNIMETCTECGKVHII